MEYDKDGWSWKRNTKIYQEIGLQALFEELEDKKGELGILEKEYYEVLEFEQNLNS